MKSSVSKPRKMTPAEAEAMAKRDKRRILLMVLTLVVLGGSYMWANFQQKQRAAEEQLATPLLDDPVEDSRLYVPPFDDRSPLEGIDDSAQEGRLIPNAEALQAVLRYTLALTGEHYAEMGAAALTTEASSALVTAPAEHRLEPYTIRGEILDLGRRAVDGASGGYAWFGTLRAQGGPAAHFAVDRDPADSSLTKGSFVLMEGLFLQVLSVEVGREWIDAPLLVSRKLATSHPYLVLNEDLMTPAVNAARDDSVQSQEGIPFDAQWQLMAKAVQENGRVDWDAAPELNAETLNALFEDGTAFRGKPFRIPISKNMDTRTRSVGENPLHIDQVSSGWIGNYTWSGKAGLVQWIGPFVDERLHDWKGSAELVQGRGFFLKNVLYQSRDGNPGRVPFFVMQGLDIHTPTPDQTAEYIMWAVLVVTMILSLLVIYLLRTERRSAARLQAELLKRRQARRNRKESAAVTPGA